MPELKRSFQSGRMNKDLDERLVPNGEYRDALNIEIASSEEDDVGSAQTTMGNKKIFGIQQEADLPDLTIEYPSLNGIGSSFYKNKTIGSIVDEKNDWGYRFVAGPPPQINTNAWPAFGDQKNYISADYIVRSNATVNEPVLVDIYSVAVGLYLGWAIPSSPINIIRIPDIKGLREGMELNVYTVDVNGAIANRGNVNTFNKKPPKIKKFLPLTNPNYRDIELTGEINLEITLVNNLVFSAPRVLNFEHDNFITGISIIDDFLLWTDDYSEPKKIHIPKSVLGCRHPFTSAGTNPLSAYHHTNFVTKIPTANLSSDKFWLGDEDPTGSFGGRPIEEKHITVIKESPHLTPVLEMMRTEGDTNTNGIVYDKDDTGIPFNPFYNSNTATSTINSGDEIWISYGGPSTPAPNTSVPCVGCTSCPPTSANPPAWPSGCTIDFSIVPFYSTGDIVIFSIPGTSPLLQIRAEILEGPDWNYGSYKVKIISSSGNIDNTSTGWISEIETEEELFIFKFPRFAIRYKYEDGEYSTYSPFTEVAFLPDKNPMDYLPEKGYNLNMTNKLRKLAIKGFIPHNNLLPDDVESIEVVYKESDISNIYSVVKIERNSSRWKALSKTANSIKYWEETTGYIQIKSEMIQGTIAPNQLLRHWDAVPRKAKAQEITGNRLLYGNYLQNYNLSAIDKVNCSTGSNIGCESIPEVETDLFFNISSSNSVGHLQPEEENVKDAWSYGPAKSIKTLRTYQLGIIYRDKYGRETPVFSDVDMAKYHEKKWADKSSHFEMAIKNIVPDFVESFKFFIKETSNEYYNLPMDKWYDAEDGNIWLSFPSSERAKISINTDEERFEDTFLILKKEHDNSVFVSDPAKYKILAIENDAPRFIKTVKTPIGVLSGLGSAIFSNAIVTGFPTPLNDFIRIVGTEFEGVGWDTSVSGPQVVDTLKIRIGTDVIKSEWYNIISSFPVSSSSPLEYEIKVDRDFKGDMVFSTSDTLSIEIVKEEVKYLPEFDGRFFVKIHKDPTLEQTILKSNLNADSYRIISSMLCQVIEPNSDWSTSNATDSWDGWGTDNLNVVTSNISPAQNFQTGRHATVRFSGYPSFSQANADPISGPDWAISTNHQGNGEQFWTSFEAQDTTNGNGNASRWFIDGRSGKNSMFQTYGRMPSFTFFSNIASRVDFEVDSTGAVIGAGGNSAWSYPRVNNVVVPSIPNNPTNDQNTLGNVRDDINDNLLPAQLAIGPNAYRPWAEEQPGNNYTNQEILDRRFKSPSGGSRGNLLYNSGIYDDSNGDTVYIDLSCLGFGGEDIQNLLTNYGIPYSNTVPGCNANCNSAWLSGNTVKYIDDVIFINAITTPGTTWRWAEDPDQTIYETQNSNTIISDWYNTGGTLGGWKRVGESSIHFNTQTIGMTTHSSHNIGSFTHFNWNTTYFSNSVIYQSTANANSFGISGITNPVDDVFGKSSSNTANWNRSQRWTIEARTLSGDELGSGPTGYLPTNDPRWNTTTASFGNTAPLKAPGVRHDGMGSGQLSNSGTTSTTYWNGTAYVSPTVGGTINPPAEYNADRGVTSGSFTWQVLLPESSLTVFGATGSFSSGNPAIWETEPKNDIDLDIYYEIGQIYATRLNERTNTLHAPVGSEVKIYRPADSDYVQANPGIPIGWIPWSTGPMLIESWNDFSGTALNPLDLTFPNEIKIVDSNGNPSTGLVASDSPFPGDILVFYRADGSTTEAMVFEQDVSLNLQFIQNKQAGYFTLDENIANRYIRPPWFNCYSFGNGVESNRIRDDFNEVIIDKGPKASTTISKTYKEERRSNGLIFSGIFNSKTGINNLNQFIEAEGITKDLNPTYGSIQKLYSRDTDIITLCEEKCLKILANKDALYNADGNINMIATSNVLGQAITYAGNYGISKNPESFASASFRSYFTDKNKGAVLRLSQDGLTPISNVGMKDWFTDNLPDAYEVIGSFDERKGDYNLTIYNHDLDTVAGGAIIELGGNTLTFNENVKGWSSFKSFLQEQGFSLNNNYYTAKRENIWKHHTKYQLPGLPNPRNNFYNKQFPYSSITFLFNESPGSVKSFNTLNYEGSQAFIEFDSTNPEYYDNIAKDGWFVNKMITNLQETKKLEFKDKEGKWFAQIKGDATTWDNNMRKPISQRGNIDPREFSYQGLDVATSVNSAACVYGCGDNGQIPNYPQRPAGYVDPNATPPNSALNYNPLVTCHEVDSCNYCIFGCTSSTGTTNYNPAATCDDGSCIYCVYGCMDPIATNYNLLATCDDNSCTYPAACIDPIVHLKSGNGMIEGPCGVYQDSQIKFWVVTDQQVTYDWTVTDSNSNVVGSGTNQASGQPNVQTISPIIPAPAISPGTTYYIDVVDSNGCTYSGTLVTISNVPMIYGCTNSLASNYNSAAQCDDGSCSVPPAYGCLDPLANNYDSTPGVLPCDNSVIQPGLVGCSSTTTPACGGPGTSPGDCCTYTVPGCTDDGNQNQAYWAFYGYDNSLGVNIPNYPAKEATNYNANATFDNSSCVYNWDCDQGYAVDSCDLLHANWNNVPISQGTTQTWDTQMDGHLNYIWGFHIPNLGCPNGGGCIKNYKLRVEYGYAALLQNACMDQSGTGYGNTWWAFITGVDLNITPPSTSSNSPGVYPSLQDIDSIIKKCQDYASNNALGLTIPNAISKTALQALFANLGYIIHFSGWSDPTDCTCTGGWTCGCEIIDPTPTVHANWNLCNNACCS